MGEEPSVSIPNTLTRFEFYTYKSCQDKCTLGCVRAASSVDNWRRQDAPGKLDPAVSNGAL